MLRTTDAVRRTSPYDLIEADVVLVTRESLRAFADVEYTRPVGVAHRIHWRRIVLDEGHTVGNFSSKQTSALLAVHADSRWIISATPNTQERPLQAAAHLLSLVRFVGGAPWTDATWLRRFRRAFAAAYSNSNHRRRVAQRSVVKAEKEEPIDDDNFVEPTDDDDDDDDDSNNNAAVVDSADNGKQSAAAAAHEFLLAYLNAVMVRHPQAVINRIIHEGIDRKVRYVQFKPHEQVTCCCKQKYMYIYS